VNLVLYKEPKGDAALKTVPLEENQSGAWSVTGPRGEWEGLYFHYEVTVFCPWTNKIETSLSTDPHSRRYVVDEGSRHYVQGKLPFNEIKAARQLRTKSRV
jgi:hypothetical protein